MELRAVRHAGGGAFIFRKPDKISVQADGEHAGGKPRGGGKDLARATVKRAFYHICGGGYNKYRRHNKATDKNENGKPSSASAAARGTADERKPLQYFRKEHYQKYDNKHAEEHGGVDRSGGGSGRQSAERRRRFVQKRGGAAGKHGEKYDKSRRQFNECEDRHTYENYDGVNRKHGEAAVLHKRISLFAGGGEDEPYSHENGQCGCGRQKRIRQSIALRRRKAEQFRKKRRKQSEKHLCAYYEAQDEHKRRTKPFFQNSGRGRSGRGRARRTRSRRRKRGSERRCAGGAESCIIGVFGFTAWADHNYSFPLNKRRNFRI